MAAIEKAYTSYITHEVFPTCVLFLDMNPTTVDVNVHPAKLEVKFANEQPVFEAVYYTVKRAIEDHEYRPEMSFLPSVPIEIPRGPLFQSVRILRENKSLFLPHPLLLHFPLLLRLLLWSLRHLHIRYHHVPQ